MMDPAKEDGFRHALAAQGRCLEEMEQTLSSLDPGVQFLSEHLRALALQNQPDCNLLQLHKCVCYLFLLLWYRLQFPLIWQLFSWNPRHFERLMEYMKYATVS